MLGCNRIVDGVCNGVLEMATTTASGVKCSTLLPVTFCTVVITLRDRDIHFLVTSSVTWVGVRVSLFSVLGS